MGNTLYTGTYDGRIVVVRAASGGCRKDCERIGLRVCDEDYNKLEERHFVYRTNQYLAPGITNWWEKKDAAVKQQHEQDQINYDKAKHEAKQEQDNEKRNEETFQAEKHKLDTVVNGADKSIKDQNNQNTVYSEEVEKARTKFDIAVKKAAEEREKRLKEIANATATEVNEQVASEVQQGDAEADAALDQLDEYMDQMTVRLDKAYQKEVEERKADEIEKKKIDLLKTQSKV